MTAPITDVSELAQLAILKLLKSHELTRNFAVHPWESRDAAKSPCLIVHVVLANWEMKSASFGIARLNCLVRARLQADAGAPEPVADPVKCGWTALFEDSASVPAAPLWERLNNLTAAYFWNWVSPAMKAEHRIDGRHFETEFTWQMKAQRVKPGNL